MDQVDPVASVLWPQDGPRKRGPRPKFTLDEVVGAAIAVADAEGLDAVTMQRVADELGAAKMALYRYVPGKSELTALMLDQALGAPPASRGPAAWRPRLLRWGLAMHERMSARPWTLDLTLGRRTPGPYELDWFERGVGALQATPLHGSEALDVLALISNHVRGSVQQAAAGEDPEAALADQLGPILAAHADRYPQTAAAFATAGESGQRDDALRFGLERILDGVAALIAERSCG